MEIPYTGRAIINDIFNGAEIIVPAKKASFFMLRFLTGAVAALVFGYFILSLKRPLSASGQQMGEFGIFGWCLFGLGLSFALSRVWWTLTGKEIITLADGVLTIVKKGAIAKTISYDLHEANNFRAVEEQELTDNRDFSKMAYQWGVAKQGTIKFDYGVETIAFGDLLNQAEGDYILQRLRSKKLIS